MVLNDNARRKELDMTTSTQKSAPTSKATVKVVELVVTDQEISYGERENRTS